MKIAQLFPDFAIELRDLLRDMGRSDLAEQVGKLPVVARCPCGQDARSGLIVLDLVNDQVVAIEVLDRPDVKRILDGFLVPGDLSGS